MSELEKTELWTQIQYNQFYSNGSYNDFNSCDPARVKSLLRKKYRNIDQLHSQTFLEIQRPTS